LIGLSDQALVEKSFYESCSVFIIINS
jgi:hypothetical protein